MRNPLRMPDSFLNGLPQPMREIAWTDVLLAAIVLCGLPIGMIVFAIWVALR